MHTLHGRSTSVGIRLNNQGTFLRNGHIPSNGKYMFGKTFVRPDNQLYSFLKTGYFRSFEYQATIRMSVHNQGRNLVNATAPVTHHALMVQTYANSPSLGIVRTGSANSYSDNAIQKTNSP